MKVLILFLSLGISLILPAYSQDNPPSTDKEALLALSKKQKKTGYILLGAGAGAVVIGGALFASNFCFLCESSSKQDALAGTGGILFLLGAGSAIASVPVLINAGKTSKRAMELSANSVPIYLPTRSHNGPRSHPALQLSFPLNQ